MALLEIDRNPSPRKLVTFGVLLLLFAVLLAALLRWRLGAATASAWVLGVGLALATLHLAVPPLRRPIYLAWTYAAYPVGWIVSHVLLALVYFGLLTPIGLAFRLVGRDPLHRRWERDAPSYWVPYEAREDADRYFRPF